MKLLFVSCLLLSTALTLPAADFPVFVNNTGTSTDQYCGLYCVFQAAKRIQQEIPLDDLIRSSRLTGRYGSTAADLSMCCTEYNIPHRFVPGASYADLYLLDRPAIVLLKSAPEMRQANHWVMLLEYGLHEARVFDPSVGVLQVKTAELQSLWGGSALVLVEPNEGSELSWLWHGTLFALSLLVFAVVFLLLRSLLAFRLKFWVILPLAALVMAGVMQLIDPASFYWNHSVLRERQAVHYPRLAEFVQPDSLIANPSHYVVVDVRDREQYEKQHIPGAINIPIDGAFWRNRQLIERYADTERLVLYCNSAQCGWAKVMAKSSLLSRFQQVTTLENGLLGYQEAQRVAELREQMP
jgi:rhodanese-related sulfurtransferase